MFISRRDFFAEAFGKAARYIPEMIPVGVCNLLGFEKDKPISADEAAFSLAKTRRKRTSFVSYLFINHMQYPFRKSEKREIILRRQTHAFDS